MRFLRFVYLFNITPFLTTCQERMGHALSIILQYLKWNRKVNKIQWILNFKTCKKPCRPVELYLAENNLTIFEKTAINSKGERSQSSLHGQEKCSKARYQSELINQVTHV